MYSIGHGGKPDSSVREPARRFVRGKFFYKNTHQWVWFSYCFAYIFEVLDELFNPSFNNPMKTLKNLGWILNIDLMCTGQVHAQKSQITDPDWTVNMEQKYLGRQTEADGFIIAADEDNLMGIDPAIRKQKSKLERPAKLMAENLDLMPATLLAFVKDKRGAFFDHLAINAGTGTVGGGSKALGFTNASNAWMVPPLNNTGESVAGARGTCVYELDRRNKVQLTENLSQTIPKQY